MGCPTTSQSCVAVTVQAIPEGDQGALEIAALLPPVSCLQRFPMGPASHIGISKGLILSTPNPHYPRPCDVLYNLFCPLCHCPLVPLVPRVGITSCCSQLPAFPLPGLGLHCDIEDQLSSPCAHPGYCSSCAVPCCPFPRPGRPSWGLSYFTSVALINTMDEGA